MNILFYCNEYPPYKTGGIGTVTKIVAEALAKRGHNIYIVGYYPSNTTLPEYSEINGVHVYRYNLGYQCGKIRKLLFQLFYKLHCTRHIIQKELSFTERKISELIEQKRIQIIELTDFYKFNAQSSGILNYTKFPVPTVLRVHGSASFLKSLQGITNQTIKTNDSRHFNRCEHISAVSEYSLKYVQENFDMAHFKTQSVIYNPIEERFLNPTPPSNSNDILFIGKLTKAKGCYSLLEAFNICAEKYPDMQLRLAGNGDIEKAKSYVKPQFIDRVHFLGFCNREQIQKEIDHCAFACIPSFFETFGMVALEIMGRQRALIFTERTSGKEIINDGENGYLINPENIDDIAKKIEILFSNNSLKKKIASNAFHSVQKFSTSKIINQLENYYTNIIHNDTQNCKKNKK